MTINDLVREAGRQPWLLVGIFAGLPAAAWITGKLHRDDRGDNAPWKFIYAVLVYLACIPGLFSAVLTGYALFFTGQNLANVDLLVYFLPIVSMVLTLVFVRWRVRFDQVPGFGRLSGLMTMIGASFVIALAIQKTRIFLFFGASIETLFVLAGAIFGLLKGGAYLLFRRRRAAARPPRI